MRSLRPTQATAVTILRGIVVWLLAASPMPAAATEVAVLKSSGLAYYVDAAQGVRTALSAHAAVTEYDVGGSASQGRAIARKLRAAPPDLIVAIGLKAALAVRLEIVDTPVVFCLVLHPESHGLPAANMTGIRMIVPADQQLAAIRSVLPKGQRLGLLYDAGHNAAFVAEARRYAASHGLELAATVVGSPADVPGALDKMLPHVDALWLVQDHTVLTDATAPLFLSASYERKLPLFTFSSTLIQHGGVAGLVLNAHDLGLQAGRLAVARLHDQQVGPGVLVDPERPLFVLNLAAAEHVGVMLSAETTRLASILYGPGALAKQTAPLDDILSP